MTIGRELLNKKCKKEVVWVRNLPKVVDVFVFILNEVRFVVYNKRRQG